MKTHPKLNHKQLLLYSSVILSFAILSNGRNSYAEEITQAPETTIKTPPQSTDQETSKDTTNQTENTTEGSNVAPVMTELQQTPSVPENNHPSPKKDRYTDLLDDWNAIIAGNAVYDKTNPDMVAFHNKAEKEVETIIQTYQGPELQNRTYLWEKTKDYTASTNITQTYRDIEKIAKQVTNPESNYYRNNKAINIVRDGMAFMYDHAYNLERENHQTTGKNNKENWWDYEIGTPRAINNTLSLMYPYFSQEEILKYTAPIEKFVPDPTRFRVNAVNAKDFPPFEANSGNLIDMGRVKLIAGLLRKDDKEIAATIKAIEKVFTLVDEGNGFYKDGSLIDHVITNKKSPMYNKGIAYTGAYGNVLIDGLSQLIPIIQKTNSPMGQDKMATIYHWINKSFFPIMVNGEMMDMTRGRSISRLTAQSHVAAVEALRAILRIADMSEEPHRTALKTRVKTLVTEGMPFYNVYDNLKTYRDIQLMKNLLDDDSIPVQKSKSYVSSFNSMDKLALYNADYDFAFGLSMFSDRTQNYEAMNNENLHGWFTADGMFYLYNSDLGHYSDNYWATVNPYYLPGTTETSKKPLEGTPENIKTKSDQVGMTSLPDGAFVRSEKLTDTSALAAMTFTNWNKSLILNKGWFILGNKIVFVGSNIQNKSTDPAYTTIEQRKEDKNHPYLTYVNGKAVNLTDQLTNFKDTKSIFLESGASGRNIGYYFFKPTTLAIRKALQTGKWNTIKADDKSAAAAKEVSNTFITITQEHAGNGDSYAYAMIPNVSRKDFEAMVANFELELLANNDKVAAIYDRKQQQKFLIHYAKEGTTFAGMSLPQQGFYTFADATKNDQKEKQEHNPSQNISDNKTDKSSYPQPTSSNQKRIQKALPKAGQSTSSLGLWGLTLLTFTFLTKHLKKVSHKD
ncbi:polysaccharide lyase 8 family protein [Streptococcus castoreus]|uniref:polysaccharide lyase 8 family protein n=1 Tax=Streptococcus castoreus TaxID=254786 RepID=UPI00056B2C72